MGFGLVGTDYVNEKGLNADKLMLQAIEASEQSERLTIPRFVSPSTGEIWNMSDFLDRFTHYEDENSTSCNRHLLICRERRDGVLPLMKVLDHVHDMSGIDVNKEISFLIGPEGGWSPEENSLFDHLSEKASGNVQSVTLGSSVLRAETCAIACTAAWTLFT